MAYYRSYIDVKPLRFQLRRKKGATLPPNTVAVSRGRGHKWGNPFVVGKPAPASTDLHPLTQEEAVALFRLWLAKTKEGRAVAVAAKAELRGKNVACWCRLDQVCHGDVWLEIANSED